MKMRVLLVEDSPAEADLAVEALRRTPAPAPEVQVADSLRGALQQLSAVRFDVVLSDLQLPDSEGLETIRALIKVGGPAVVAYTGSIGRHQGVAAVQAGADDFVTKGLDGLQLRAVLEQAVARRRRAPAPSDPDSRLEELFMERTSAFVDSSRLLRLAAGGPSEFVFIAQIEPPRVLFANEAYRNMYGRDPAQLLVDPADWLEAVHPQDRARMGEILGRSPTDEPEAFRFRFVHPDRGERCAQGHLRVTRDAEGRPKYLAAFIQDFTDAVRAEDAQHRALEKDLLFEATEKANRFKASFLNMAAHELSNPLTPIRLQLASLRLIAGATADARLGASLQVMDRNVARLAGLVQDLLEAGRLQAGAANFAWKDTDVAALCRQAVAGMRPVAEEAGVKVTVRAPGSLPARADPDRLSIVLLNLLSNAIKYTPKGGHATVLLASDDGHARLEVADNGRGVRPQDQGQLFQPFVRVGDTTSVKGTGLGLHISKAIVEAHGGTISFKSEGEGKGAVFTVRIPLTGPAANPSPSPSAP